MKELMKEIARFNEERDWDQFHTPNNLAKSIVIEANELLEHYQFSQNDEDISAIGEEIADVMSYCLMMCERLDLDPEEIIRDKMKKNALKYPADKVRGKNKKYDEY